MSTAELVAFIGKRTSAEYEGVQYTGMVYQ